MIRVSLLVLAGLLAACDGGGDAPAEAASMAGAAPSAQGPAPEETRREHGKTLFASLAGAWAVPGGCGDAAREWRIEAKGFHAAHLNCDLLFVEQIEGGVRAVADCLVEGFSDGAEDSFLLSPRPDGGLVIIDEIIGDETPELMRCERGL